MGEDDVQEEEVVFLCKQVFICFVLIMVFDQGFGGLLGDFRVDFDLLCNSSLVLLKELSGFLFGFNKVEDFFFGFFLEFG